jgi:hypothetical protein
VFIVALFAYDDSARARHGEGGMMFQAMDFDYVCKHVSVGEWGMEVETERRRDREKEGGRNLNSPCLSVSLSLRLSVSHSPLPLRLQSRRRGLHGAPDVNASEMAAIIARRMDVLHRVLRFGVGAGRGGDDRRFV